MVHDRPVVDPPGPPQGSEILSRRKIKVLRCIERLFRGELSTLLSGYLKLENVYGVGIFLPPSNLTSIFLPREFSGS